jgi:hypothetical protein
LKKTEIKPKKNILEAKKSEVKNTPNHIENSRNDKIKAFFPNSSQGT